MRKEKPRGQMGRYNCDACGKDFTARVADRNRGWARFCSKTCKAKKLDSAPAKPKTKDYPNERDCEHGRQRGKCDSCDLVKAEQRIAELEKDRDELEVKIIAAEGKRNELAATVNRLRDLLTSAFEQSEEVEEVLREVGGRNHHLMADQIEDWAKEAEKALGQTDGQTLNAVKREVALDLINAGRLKLALEHGACKDEICHFVISKKETLVFDLEKYVGAKYPSGKDGE